MEPQGKNHRISVSHAETKQNPLPGEDHSQSRVHVQTVGLNAETKKERHRADGEMFLLTFPFIGLVRYARLPGVRYKKAARMIERLDLFRVFQITSTQFIALALANLKCSLRPRQFMSKAAAS